MVNRSSASSSTPKGMAPDEAEFVSPLTARQQKTLNSRRRFLKGIAAGSLGVIAVAFAFPILAIKALSQYTDTVAEGDVIGNVGANTPTDVASFPVNTAAYVGPLGKPTQFAQNLMELVRVGDAGTADDFRCYSRICTHLGCSVDPVLNAEGHIHCSCHGSQFDKKSGDVVHGPATRTLPHIPVKLNDQNQLVVDGDYSGRIGAGS